MSDHLNEGEILALVALVNQETEIMRAENTDRERNGYAQACVEYGPYALRLGVWLQDRGVMK